MKTLLKITLGLMIGSVAMASCEDDADDPKAIAQERLQHIWLVDSTTVRTVTTSSDDTVSTPGTGNDYVDFRSDGKVYSKFGTDEPDTASYELLNESQIKIDADTFTLQTLTNSRLIGSIKYQLNPTNYNVVTSYLRR
ncbi:hypothetical protein [Ferruginibacter sp. HRS2-29]|uniref:hypothetical protein n=1 Tax=Ferruginibacter sp. HRS2-29 TaxID=2487334 RepID=UPI0020CF3048|nr:hypothetical protein [Ferruginibacter sp. HRS2-29]MCP9752589.1 hypothetical protein [Ferruginibacter sp. HRS2-29]